MRVLIAGCGYLGLAIGARQAADGATVAGIRRPGADPGPLRAVGITPLFADLTRPGDLAALPAGWDRVVLCAAPADADDDSYRAVYQVGARNLIDWLRLAPAESMVFTGSTRVYPQTDGSEVTEESPASPRVRGGADSARGGGDLAGRGRSVLGWRAFMDRAGTGSRRCSGGKPGCTERAGGD